MAPIVGGKAWSSGYGSRWTQPENITEALHFIKDYIKIYNLIS